MCERREHSQKLLDCIWELIVDEQYSVEGCHRQDADKLSKCNPY